MLINLVLEYVIRKLELGTTGTLLYKSSQIVEFADDIIIMARSIPDTKEVFLELNEAAQEVGLRINEKKRKSMAQTKRQVPIR